MRPADAMGAVLRANHAIVVGDQKQLPPTSFFDRLLNGEEVAEYEDATSAQASQVSDMESILALCEARGMPGGMLRWHYRSRHESLIAVSNQEFYESKLICPPSPLRAKGETGLTLEFVHGVYGRGKRRDNPEEAKVVAEAVLAHARQYPAESLGVVALSVSQRNTIRDKIEFTRTEHPELDAFCSESREDAFL